jgi:uncharacterized protein (TIGR03437 family)
MSRTHQKITLLLVLAAAVPCAQSVTPPAGRQQDLNYIANTLPQLDRNFFYQLDPGTYQQAVGALQARITTATDAEFYVGLQQLVAMSNDPHTNLNLAYVYGLLPLSLYWFEDGLFVTAAAPEYAKTIGTQLIAVNGMPIDQVEQRLGTTFPYANNQWFHSQIPTYVTSSFMLQGLDIIPAGLAAVPMTFQTSSGQQFIATISSSNNAQVTGSPGPTPDYLQNPNSYYWYTYVAANRMIYAKYNVCEDDPNGITVAAYAAQILQTLDANPVDTVVIDFRENGGGNEYLLYPLGVGLFQRLASLRANPNFRIYLVIDQGSFSSGMYTPMAFKSGFLASMEHIPMPDTSGVMYVIGEPTGGKPIGFADIVVFKLPYWGATGYYSTDYIDQNEGVIPDLPSFNPDIYVPTRSTDYFAGFDPVMAAMLARFTGAPPPPSGTAITVNGANFRPAQGLAPGSIAAAFGSFSATPDRVLVNGAAATMYGASQTQVTFAIPASVSPGLATISVRAAAQELANGQATITAAGPGIFVLDPANPSQPGAVENQDYAVNSSQKPALRGSAISIYATGYGPLDPSGSAAVRVYFGDTPAQVLYSAPVAASPGLWQINAQVPADIPPGVSSLFLVAGNIASNAVTINVQ